MCSSDLARVARAFRHVHGCSVGTFVRRLRVARAQELLRRTAARIATVAVDAGFYDQSHLGRVFRAEIGMTPRQYRALAGRPEIYQAPPRPYQDVALVLDAGAVAR